MSTTQQSVWHRGDHISIEDDGSVWVVDGDGTATELSASEAEDVLEQHGYTGGAAA